MIQGYDQVLKASGTFGGSKVVFEGHPELLIGGFDFATSDLWGAGVVLPCGTPVNCDEANRTITPLITTEVKAIDGTDAKIVTLVDNGFNGPALKVGDYVAVINSTLDTNYENTTGQSASTTFAQIVAIDGFVITLGAAISSLAVGDILVVVKLNSTTGKAAIAAVPNALLPYDKVYDNAATLVHGDGAYTNDRPVLTRRMPPITDAIKTALANAGCTFKWSDRK